MSKTGVSYFKKEAAKVNVRTAIDEGTGIMTFNFEFPDAKDINEDQIVLVATELNDKSFLLHDAGLTFRIVRQLFKLDEGTNKLSQKHNVEFNKFLKLMKEEAANHNLGFDPETKFFGVLLKDIDNQLNPALTKLLNFTLMNVHENYNKEELEAW